MSIQHGGSGKKDASVMLENIEFCPNHAIPDYPALIRSHGMAYIKPFLYSCGGYPPAMSGEVRYGLDIMSEDYRMPRLFQIYASNWIWRQIFPDNGLQLLPSSQLVHIMPRYWRTRMKLF